MPHLNLEMLPLLNLPLQAMIFSLQWKKALQPRLSLLERLSTLKNNHRLHQDLLAEEEVHLDRQDPNPSHEMFLFLIPPNLLQDFCLRLKPVIQECYQPQFLLTPILRGAKEGLLIMVGGGTTILLVGAAIVAVGPLVMTTLSMLLKESWLKKTDKR